MLTVDAPALSTMAWNHCPPWAEYAQEAVSVASFYLWRSKLAGSQGRSRPSRAVVVRQPKADFLDLGTLDTRTHEARPPAEMASRCFELRLDLGGGLQLHLVRS